MRNKNIDKKSFNYRIGRSSAGLGLFAQKEYKRGEKIIEYTGELISTDEANERGGKYLFEINSRWTIDGKDRKNISRYINHSCQPNAEAVISGRRVFIFARKKIKIGEEICYDYGREYYDEYIKPLGCKCSACLDGK
ncbi:MAG TPA: SET domain-containing protein [Candidatus Vogelbacteria bacterium]|nr:SET domain-containing protein [Candidatus Vogelbacteria bacterium]